MIIYKKNRICVAAAVTALGLLLAGCGVNQNADIKENSSNQILENKAVEVTAEATAVYPVEPEFKSEDERMEYSRNKRMMLPETFITAYHDFAVMTSAAVLKDSSENVVYSPLSLYYALAMVCDGAEGETQEEMLDLLGYDTANALAEDCKTSFEALYHVPNEKNNKPNEWGEYDATSRYTMRFANSLWVDDVLELKKGYADCVAQNFYADVFKGDLQSDETAKKKSEWVNERTNGLIKPAEEPADMRTVLSVINTLYFYDEWLYRFAKEATEADTFTLADGSEVTCDYMNTINSSGGFRRGENYTASSLSLKNGAMVFVLPDEGVDVNELTKDSATLAAALGDGGESLYGRVTWKVPKFSYGSSLSLGYTLQTLGMESAFGEDAELGMISDMEPLFISSVIQDTHLGIDEEGVEGAAYTEILLCGAGLPKDEAEMILNRPFLYAVTNNGQIVFVGICENPVENGAG